MSINSYIFSQNGYIAYNMEYLFNLNSTITFYGKLYFGMFTVQK